MRIRCENLPRFLAALILAAIFTIILSEELGLRYTISVPTALFLVNQLQSRGII